MSDLTLQDLSDVAGIERRLLDAGLTLSGIKATAERFCRNALVLAQDVCAVSLPASAHFEPSHGQGHGQGQGLHGVDLAFSSDLPPAAGMSSSSAMIVMTFLALNELNQLSSHDAFRRNIHFPEDLAGYLGAMFFTTPAGPSAFSLSSSIM